MNKQGQITGYVRFGATTLITTIMFLLLRKPVINPMIDEAVNAVTDPFTKVLLKFIPIVFIFFMVLILTSLLSRGAR